MRVFCCVVLLLSTLSQVAEAKTYRGMWLNEEFSIELDSTFNEIRGQWGSRTYNIDVDSNFNRIRGKISEEVVNLDIDMHFYRIQGTLPCGQMDLRFDLNWKKVSGTHCGSQMRLEDIESNEEVVDLVRELVLGAVIENNFPHILRRQVKRFIAERIRFL